MTGELENGSVKQKVSIANKIRRKEVHVNTSTEVHIYTASKQVLQ